MKIVSVAQEIGHDHFQSVAIALEIPFLAFDDFDYFAIVPDEYEITPISNIRSSIGRLGSNGDNDLSFFTKTVLDFKGSTSNSKILVREFMYGKEFKEFLTPLGMFLDRNYYYLLSFDDSNLASKIFRDLHSTGLFFGFIHHQFDETKSLDFNQVSTFFTDCFDGEYEIFAQKRVPDLVK